MSGLNFSTAPVPDDSEDTPDIPQDVSPGTDLHCLVCGKPLEYSGRGRKPKYCDEHKKSPKGARAQVRSSSVKNERLASQATDALMQINGMVAFLCFIAGMPATHEAINAAEAGLRVQVHNALLTDPDLCAQILKAGTSSAKVSLIIAYGMFGAVVAPVAALEIRNKRAEKLLARDAEDSDDGEV